MSAILKAYFVWGKFCKIWTQIQSYTKHYKKCEASHFIKTERKQNENKDMIMSVALNGNRAGKTLNK